MRFGILFSSASHTISDDLVFGRYRTFVEATTRALLAGRAQAGIRSTIMQTTNGRTWTEIETGASVDAALIALLRLTDAGYEARFQPGPTSKRI